MVEQSLYALGVPPTLRGYRYLIYIIEQAALDPQRVRYITKDLYRETAHTFHTSWPAVEHCVRTAIRVCWDSGGKEKLGEMTGHHLTERPRATAFIAIVA